MLSLEALWAREEVRQVIYRHFRAADRLDVELEFASCWEDAVFEGGPLDGPMGAAIPTIYREMLPKYFEVTNHYMMNLLIDVKDHDAYTETYCIAYHIVPASLEAIIAVIGPTRFAELGGDAGQRYELLLGIRYTMQLQRRDGIWKIAFIKIVNDWSRAEPYQGIATDEGVYGFLKLRGARDRSDPSYPWNP